MIQNRKEIAKEWAEDAKLSYAEVARNHNLDRRTVWNIVRSFYSADKIKEIMAWKRSNRRKVYCVTCQKQYEVKYPCLKKYEKSICPECKASKKAAKESHGEQEGSK